MTSRYAELLGDNDLSVLGRVSGHGPGDRSAAWFRSRPSRIESALDDPATYEGLFGADTIHPGNGLDPLSPLLVFAVMIHHGAAEVAQRTHIPERLGNSLVIPVFDGERLARFASSTEAKIFLVELLGSYTRVLSGPRWEKSSGRWRRRRFSEMNPVHLAELAASLPTAERAGAYRRLGDLALFLNGVFADHAARQTLSPIELERLLRSLPDDERSEAIDLLGLDRIDATGPVLAKLGPSWYRAAARVVPIPTSRAQLADAAEHFDEARRFLSFVTDRFLWNRKGHLFGGV